METDDQEFEHDNAGKESYFGKTSFYTHVFSSSFVIVVGVLAIAFGHTFLAIRRNPGGLRNEAVVVAVILPLFFLAILFHRYQVRRLIRGRSENSPILREMSSMLVTVAVTVSLIAILAVR